MGEISRSEAIEILNRDDNEMRKGYFCINDFLAIEKAKADMQKLENYETKLKSAYGECDTLLDVVVNGLVKQAEECKIGQPRKARLLTDEDVDLWEQAKSDREKLKKIEACMNQAETMKLNGWTLEETLKMSTQLMQKEGNMLVWDALRHLRDYVEWYKYEIEQILKGQEE